MPSVETIHFDAVRVIVPEVHEDDRGFFMESYRKDAYKAVGVDADFVQDNHSRSARGVLRGMHFQWDPPQGKLVRVTRGAAFIALIDIRYDSPTVGQWVGIEVTEANKRQIWVPPGFAHGFCTVSEWLDVQYKCTGYYNPACEAGIRWDDPAVGIEWPIETPILSSKDAAAQTLEEWLAQPESRKFSVQGATSANK